MSPPSARKALGDGRASAMMGDVTIAADSLLAAAPLPARADVAIIGAGILGLAVARELLARHPDTRIAVLEREATLAAHQTGHNSGVLHAGLYYTPGSLKARLTRQGQIALERYAAERGIAFERCGKLVVALDESELGALDTLRQRAEANQVPGWSRSRESDPRDRAAR